MRMKASFDVPLAQPPILKVGTLTVPGRMTDTRGEMWAFHATDLAPGRRYTPHLAAGTGRSLCQPWDLSTFPSPDARPARLRVLFFTCAGGHEGRGFLPSAVRNRMLRRALSFNPDAAVANGDHVYWDLRSPLTTRGAAGAALAREIAGGSFNRGDLVLGSDNETMLKVIEQEKSGAIMAPRIVPAGFLEGESKMSARNGFVVSDLAAAKKAVDWYAAHGYPPIKIYNPFPKAILKDPVA